MSISGLDIPKSYAAGGLRGSVRQVEGIARTRQEQERRVSTTPVDVETIKLTASDAKLGDHYGLEVAIDGSTIVVGAYGAGTSGAAYVIDCSVSSSCNATKLTSPNAGRSENFGLSVAISGSTVVIGSSNSTYIFSCPGPPITNCTEMSKLTASDAVEGEEDAFGRAVAISGSTVVVGARRAKCISEIDGSVIDECGAAYIFDCSTSLLSCNETDKLTAGVDASYWSKFGRSVDIAGPTVVVGSHYHDGRKGAAYVFDCSILWNCSRIDMLTLHPDAQNSDHFGNSVAVFGYNVVVGAWATDKPGLVDSGSAYLFDCSSLSSCTKNYTLIASDAAAGDFFGGSVAISGSKIVVGAFWHDVDTHVNSGSAYIFECSTSSCNETHKLVASDASAEDRFGAWVAISGSTVVVGAPFDDDGGSNSGSAYIYLADTDQDGVPDSIDLCPNTTDIGAPDVDDNGCSEDQRAFSVSAPSFHFVVPGGQNLGLVCDTGYKQDLLRIAWDSYDPIVYTDLPGVVPSVAGVYPIRVVVVVDGVEIDMSEEMQVVVYEDSDEDGSPDSSDSDDNESD